MGIERSSRQIHQSIFRVWGAWEIASDGIWKMKYCSVTGIMDFRLKFWNGLPTNRREFIVSQRRGNKFLNCKSTTLTNINLPINCVLLFIERCEYQNYNLKLIYLRVFMLLYFEAIAWWKDNKVDMIMTNENLLIFSDISLIGQMNYLFC